MAPSEEEETEEYIEETPQSNKRDRFLRPGTPPSVKYRDVEPPNKVQLAAALAAPRPTLPRQHRGSVRSRAPGLRESNPLGSSLKGEIVFLTYYLKSHEPVHPYA